MNTEIPELNLAGLRRLAFTTACLLVGVFGVVFPLLHHRQWPLWPWYFALALILWGVFLPARLRLLYRSWMKLALIIGRVNSTLILGIIFICFISPIGILLRLFGYDPLRKKYLALASSYRTSSVIPQNNHMEKPY